MPHVDRVISLRISVRRPPPGVAFAVQRGAAELIPPSVATPDALVFEVPVRVGEPSVEGVPRFLGPMTQGPPSARFVYVNSGARAGQPTSCWDRRAKVPLSGITMSLVDDAIRGGQGCVETEFEGTGPDGGPTCATVKGIVWRIA